MADLIDRQAAIDAVETKIKKWNAVDGEGYHVGLGLRYTDVIDTLTELPSVQPEIMYYPQVDGVTASIIAQPEIVRCKDCKHYAGDGMYCAWDIMVHYEHFYCYHAERRTYDE